jgi:predicted PurR-regulated permease PerM
MLKFIGWLFNRIFLVLGALVGSQVPEFIQQYTQRLGGHVDELSHLLLLIKQSAALSNKSLDIYIQKFMTNSDPDFVIQGQFMQSMLSRWENLTSSLSNIIRSSIWTKPFVFITQIDKEIFSSTTKSFHPGFTLTIEGLLYTALGMTISCSLYHAVLKAFKTVFSKKMKQETQKT